jgi:hypothetical protein
VADCVGEGADDDTAGEDDAGAVDEGPLVREASPLDSDERFTDGRFDERIPFDPPQAVRPSPSVSKNATDAPLANRRECMATTMTEARAARRFGLI